MPGISFSGRPAVAQAEALCRALAPSSMPVPLLLGAGSIWTAVKKLLTGKEACFPSFPINALYLLVRRHLTYTRMGS